MDEVECPQCGEENSADANFCSVCGAELEREDASPTAAHEAISVEAGETLTLVVIRGANAGSRFAATGELTTIGRHPDSSVFLDDVTVSRRHAEIRRQGSTFDLTDVGSLNGTYLNGTRIDHAVLSEGDQLQVGKYKLVVVIDDDSDDGRPAADDE